MGAVPGLQKHHFACDPSVRYPQRRSSFRGRRVCHPPSILYEYADREEENGQGSRLTSNSIGLFTCGPQVKMSCSKAHGPLLDVKLKVLSINRIDGQKYGIYL